MRSQMTWAHRPTPINEIRSHVRKLLYLRTPERVLSHLRYEYGDRPLPSLPEVERIMDRARLQGTRRVING